MEYQTVVLVTGASRGIGRAIALKYAKEGASLALTARDRKALDETASMIRNDGGKDPLLLPADLQDVDQISGIVEQVMKTFNHINVLVNNAGIGHLKPFLELTIDEFQQMMDINMRAVFALTQNVIPHMIEQNSGTVINIASLAGKNGFKSGTGYAASKWALRGFAQCLMPEVREHNIRVVTIFPGSVYTEFGSGGPHPTGTPPKNRMLPEDVAETAYMAFAMPDRTMISEIDMRPSNPKR